MIIRLLPRSNSTERLICVTKILSRGRPKLRLERVNKEGLSLRKRFNFISASHFVVWKPHSVWEWPRWPTGCHQSDVRTPKDVVATKRVQAPCRKS